MERSSQNWTRVFGSSLRAATAALALPIVFSLTAAAAQSVEAPTFNVIHDFTGPDGAEPYAGLTIDAEGNFYGTTAAGGNTGGNCGTGAAVRSSS